MSDTATLDRLEATLAEDELARARRFISEQDRCHYVAAHGVLRNVLGRYLERAPQSIEFVRGPHGKPAIASSDSQHPLRFNLSHSQGMAIIGVVLTREIGVDLELVRPEFASGEIATRYFSQGEVAELAKLPDELKAEGFFLCWTRKEAYIKARGEGLSLSLKSFSVSLTPGAPAVLDSQDHSKWCMHSLEFDSGYVAAMVVEGNDLHVRRLCWTL